MSRAISTNDRADGNSTQLHVRPYLLTGGRTQSEIELAVETLLRTTDHGEASLQLLTLEPEEIVELCREAVSLAEVAARLGLPLQVARVLVGDLISEGMIEAHATTDFSSDRPDLNLLERVLDGLQSL